MRDGVMLGSDAPRAAPPPPSSIYSRLLAELGGSNDIDRTKMVSMVSRQGRQLQRYSKTGSRIVVGYVVTLVWFGRWVDGEMGGVVGVSDTEWRSCCRCIPYKFNAGGIRDDDIGTLMEVLVVSSPKGNGLLFPKVCEHNGFTSICIISLPSLPSWFLLTLQGGWETDETIEQAALREALEEAGVQGNVEGKLGKWRYKSRAYDAYHEGIMFPMNVTQELGDWPEMHLRERKWVSTRTH
ncbi:hypothetical protein B296_00040480 [Ensete ventricosum]|uniref:Nudix hydrolase domain-containing protein n=1 Tax=Ensete ventricosum TaxID=4639 RepID=A0A426XC80_ENSVE|nr:hypothetical protein B296_00040480 [Ensete ventricosum]